MSYQLIKNLTAVNYTRGNNRQIKYIVLHYTGNSTDTAKNNANYFKSVNRGASAHYFVDESTIYQIVEDANISWAVGKNYGTHNLFGVVTNANSINIEMCSSGGRIADATFNNAAALTKSLMSKYGVPASNVYRHYDVCSKQCPGWPGWGTTKNDTGALWTSFKNLLNKEEKTNIQEALKMGIAVLRSLTGDLSQRWRPQHNKDGTTTLINAGCGLALDIPGGSAKSGTMLQTYQPNDTISQKFTMKQAGGNYVPSYVAPVYFTAGTNKSLVLDCINGGTANNTRIQTYAKNLTKAQLWSIVDCGDGTWALINTNSLKALTAA